MIDLSLGGCRLQMQDRFLAGILVRIEIAVRISGLSQRFGGVTQWTDRKQLDVIRFLDMSDRKRSQLNDLIREVMEFRDERETASKDQRGPRRIDVE